MAAFLPLPGLGTRVLVLETSGGECTGGNPLSSTSWPSSHSPTCVENRVGGNSPMGKRVYAERCSFSTLKGQDYTAGCVNGFEEEAGNPPQAGQWVSGSTALECPGDLLKFWCPECSPDQVTPNLVSGSRAQCFSSAPGDSSIQSKLRMNDPQDRLGRQRAESERGMGVLAAEMKVWFFRTGVIPFLV